MGAAMSIDRLADSAVEVCVREANAKDVASIVALLADDDLGRSRETVTSPVHDSYVCAFEEMQSHPGITELVAASETGVVGCLQLSILPGLARCGSRRALIEAVRVASHCRNRGIGQLLVSAAVDRARAADCAFVWVTSDRRRVDAHRFYARLGFVASHEGMKLTLDSSSPTR
jgi:GNAT superfamily N-acetyltransferase